VKLRDLALGQRLQNEFEQSVAGAKAIPAPFDQALLGDDSAPGRQAIARTIAALRQQTTTLAEVAALFDVRVALAAGVGR
jgi:putative iron-regulated protein